MKITKNIFRNFENVVFEDCGDFLFYSCKPAPRSEIRPPGDEEKMYEIMETPQMKLEKQLTVCASFCKFLSANSLIFFTFLGRLCGDGLLAF